ncbi:MAG: 16S rRNA (cytosine(1402)-N(4))-methyltransferase RsmH [Planctomycetaceae bacterium]|nr:16S rRNA (cytosine(1402)-N(4))-methyltransferase RsmH [Planctomycetaceae bacterium]
MSAGSVHVPVMYREVMQYLQLTEGLIVVDGTVGAAGHSVRIRDAIGSSGHLIALDRDPMMLRLAAERLAAERLAAERLAAERLAAERPAQERPAPERPDTYPLSTERPAEDNRSNVTLVNAAYTSAESVVTELGYEKVDRVLLDLGLSSDQLADSRRGFGFDAGGPLDMRFNPSEGISAAQWLNEAQESDIERVLVEFGEQPSARRIAAEICRRRYRSSLKTTEDLEACVRAVLPNRPGNTTGRNPATQVFQALRIHVNRELDHVRQAVSQTLPAILKPGGIAVVLTFHSLEDRIVKSAFKEESAWQILTKTPVKPTPAEVRINPRSRSAKLRAAERRTE